MTSSVRIIAEPTVTLIGRPAFDEGAARTHLAAVNGVPVDEPVLCGHGLHGPDGHPDAQVLIESGGRMCYQSHRGGRPHKEHVRHVVKVGHHSVLEHAQFTFLVAGVSRALSHELARHRHLSPSQLSQRYVDQTDHGLGFVVPPALLNAHATAVEEERKDREPMPETPPDRWAYSTWHLACDDAADRYREMAGHLTAAGLPRKQAREAARSVLPECAETRLQISGNLRAWLEFFPKRCSAAADAEMRRFACRVFNLLVPEAPDVFAHLARRPLPDGTFEL